MQLGVKWSPISESVADLIDVQEVAGWSLDEHGLPFPALLHNIDLDFSLTRPGIATPEWIERVEWALDQTGSPWFSIHLGFSAEDVRFEDHMHPASAPLSRSETFERSRDHLSYLRERLNVPLLIENLDYCPEGAYEHICDPEFISEICSATGSELLLDLAHARVSADWLGIDAIDYIERLPLYRVREIHVSGPRRFESRLDDCHMHLTEDDYEILTYVLGNTDADLVVLEYVRDSRRLAEQVVRLRELMQECMR